ELVPARCKRGELDAALISNRNVANDFESLPRVDVVHHRLHEHRCFVVAPLDVVADFHWRGRRKADDRFGIPLRQRHRPGVERRARYGQSRRDARGGRRIAGWTTLSFSNAERQLKAPLGIGLRTADGSVFLAVEGMDGPPPGESHASGPDGEYRGTLHRLP